jgi:hypothetical protein
MPFLVNFASLRYHHPSRYRFDHPRAKTQQVLDFSLSAFLLAGLIT